MLFAPLPAWKTGFWVAAPEERSPVSLEVEPPVFPKPLEVWLALLLLDPEDDIT